MSDHFENVFVASICLDAANCEDPSDVPDLFLSEYLSSSLSFNDEGDVLCDVWLDGEPDDVAIKNAAKNAGFHVKQFSVRKENSSFEDNLNESYHQGDDDRAEVLLNHLCITRCADEAQAAPQPEAGKKEILLHTPLAFGDGFHPTSLMCMQMIEALYDEGTSIQHALDVGSGSGILSLGLAALWSDVSICATDIEAHAVQTTKDNWVRNGFNPDHLQVYQDGTLEAEALIKAVRERPFDLVVANILKGPLEALAPRIRALGNAPGALILLSGLLEEQKDDVVQCYQALGYTLKKQKAQHGWACLLLELQ